MTNKWIVMVLKSDNSIGIDGELQIGWVMDGIYGPYSENKIEELKKKLIDNDEYTFEFYCLKNFEE